MEIVRQPPQFINYYLTYNKYIIKIFTNDVNYQNINKFYIYINSSYIISITLTNQNSVNFCHQDNVISTFDVTNISEIEILQNVSGYQEKQKNIIICCPFTFNFLNNNSNIINISNIISNARIDTNDLDLRINLFNLININFIG